jgi:hypothetical protein
MLVILAAALALPAPPAGAAIAVDDALVFTRPDGSVLTYPTRVRVWCGRWGPDVRTRTIHVQMGRRARSPLWWLRAVVADVRRDRRVDLPHSFVWTDPTEAQMFVGDGTNEISSATERSSGRIVFERIGCGPRLRIRFRVDATLGSEFFDGDTIAVTGTFSARAGPRPEV